MRSHHLAGLGFVLAAAGHLGFVALNLALFEQPGYAFAATILAASSLLSALALRHGWDDHAPLFAWSTLAAGLVVAGRWAVAELGQPLDVTSPFALLLPIGAGLVASAGWSLWRGFMDPGGERALRRLAAGSGLRGLGEVGFAVVVFTAGGIVIGLVLLVALVGSSLTAWGAQSAARSVAQPPPTIQRPRPAVRNP